MIFSHFLMLCFCVPYKFNSNTFWLWSVLGSLIAVGPLVYLSKFCKAMNFLANDYNVNG